MATKKATELELSEIHGAMATWCKLVLQGTPLLDSDGKAVLKEDGQPWLVPPSSAHMNVIRQFLKDNKIDNPKTEDKVNDVVPDLPSFENETAFTTPH
jgi:hypothetical protein